MFEVNDDSGAWIVGVQVQSGPQLTQAPWARIFGVIAARPRQQAVGAGTAQFPDAVHREFPAAIADQRRHATLVRVDPRPGRR
jgi:hypothetical protein